MEMNTSKPGPDDEEEDIDEAVPKTKLTFNSLAEQFPLFRNAFDFFCNMDTSMIWALKLKQKVGGFVLYRNGFTKMKKQNIRQKLQCIAIKLHQVCLPSCLPPLLPLPPLKHHGYPLLFLLLLLLLSLLNVKMMRVKTFMMIHSHLMHST